MANLDLRSPVLVPAPSSPGSPVRNDDSRLSDSRTPLAHALSHAVGGSDVLTPRAIGARLDLVPTTLQTTGPITAAVGQLVMVDASAGPITVNLPSLTVGAMVGVKKTDASANVVTIVSAAGQTIGFQAAASTPLSTQYQVTELQYYTATNWAIVGGQLGLASLDARFAAATRQVLAGTGLSGGGNLTADRTLAVVYGTTAGTALQGNDPSVTNARTPTAHASTHNTGGSDEIGIIPPNAKSANYTLVDSDRTVIFDTASGNLTATLPTPVGRSGKRFCVKKVSAAGTKANSLTIATAAGSIDGGTTEVISVAGGFREFESDGTIWHIVGGAVVPVINALSSVGAGGTISIDASIASVYRVNVTGATATLAVPTNPIDGDQIIVEVLASVAHTLTINASILLTTGLSATVAIASGKRWFGGLRWVSGVGWFLVASTVQS